MFWCVVRSRWGWLSLLKMVVVAMLLLGLLLLLVVVCFDGMHSCHLRK